MPAPLERGASICRHSTPGQSHPCSAGDLLRLQDHETNLRANQLAGNGGQHYHHGGFSDSDYYSAGIAGERLSRLLPISKASYSSASPRHSRHTTSSRSYPSFSLAPQNQQTPITSSADASSSSTP